MSFHPIAEALMPNTISHSRSCNLAFPTLRQIGMKFKQRPGAIARELAVVLYGATSTLPRPKPRAKMTTRLREVGVIPAKAGIQ